ncbi:MAG TPA: ClbS/DfsB family four-helix bundle protein [Dehalococcoidia bacterium]|nr:ClbS/DfsB family four-helix bundle protein [Dehalococcoidia bacterium]
MTKDELLAAMRRDRARLDALIAPLDGARMTEPALEGGWSVKDVLAQISLWERACAGWFEAAARDETPERPEVRDVDETNARGYEAAKGRALGEVVAESRASHEALRRAVAALPDEELAGDKRFGWPGWQVASSNSDEHYREHIGQISRWPGTPG